MSNGHAHELCGVVKDAVWRVACGVRAISNQESAISNLERPERYLRVGGGVCFSAAMQKIYARLRAN